MSGDLLVLLLVHVIELAILYSAWMEISFEQYHSIPHEAKSPQEYDLLSSSELVLVIEIVESLYFVTI